MRTTYRLVIATAIAGFPIQSQHVLAQLPIESYWIALSEAQTLDAAMVVPATGTDDPRTHEIAQGLQRLRKYEFTLDRTDALMSLKYLEHAVRVHPDDPWAHYALGTSLARGSDMRLRPYAQKSSYKPGVYSMAALRAPKELQRALEIDGSLDLAAIELGQVALDLTDKNLMVKALEFLSRARSRAVPMAVFMSARLESRLGNSARAIELGNEARSLGVDASVVALERVLALSRMGAPPDTVAKAYFDGIDVMTEQGAERYFAGLVQLASKAEIEAWRRADTGEKRQWIRRFWAKRAAIAGQPTARQISALYQKYNRAYDIRGMTVIGGRPP